MTNETLQVIKQRRSIRSYAAAQLTDEEVQAIVEAGSYAPHAGEQAWHFTVVQDADLLRRLNLAAKEAARQMDMPHLQALGRDEQFDCLYGAPTLIIVSGDEHSPIPLEADCAAATQNMLLAAASLGLGSCWIFFVQLAFYAAHGADLRQALHIPEGYKPYYSAVFGYKQATVDEVPARKADLVTYVR